jgi:hypothetical protein
MYRAQNGLCFAAYNTVHAAQSSLFLLIVSSDLIGRQLIARLLMGFDKLLSQSNVRGRSP